MHYTIFSSIDTANNNKKKIFGHFKMSHEKQNGPRLETSGLICHCSGTQVCLS